MTRSDRAPPRRARRRGPRGLRPRGRATSPTDTRAHRHRRLRRHARCERAEAPEVGGEDTVMRAAAAQREGRDALRRRLRAVDRRASAAGATTGGRSTGSSTSTASTPTRAPAAIRRPRRRPHLVGPPRLGRDAARPGRRRLVPRAVRARHRRQAAAGRGSSARRPGCEACRAVARPAHGLTRSRPRSAGCAARPRQETLRVLVGRWAEIRGDAASATLEQRPAGQRRLRAPERGRPAHRAARRPRARRGARSARGAGLVAATRAGGRPAGLGRHRHRRRRASRRRGAALRRGRR